MDALHALMVDALGKFLNVVLFFVVSEWVGYRTEEAGDIIITWPWEEGRRSSRHRQQTDEKFGRKSTSE